MAKNFLDFIEDASKPDLRTRDDFFRELNKDDVTAEKLYQFLQNKGYDGVSKDDCAKMMAVKENVGKIDIDGNTVKY
jgi:hypothetical protein